MIAAGRAILSGEAKTTTQAKQIAGYPDPRNGRPTTTALVEAALKAGYGGKSLSKLRGKSFQVIEKALDDDNEQVAIAVLKISQDAGETEQPDAWREGSARATQQRWLLRYMRRGIYLALRDADAAARLLARLDAKLGFAVAPITIDVPAAE